MTAAHGFLEVIDAIAEDMYFDAEYKNEVKKLGERMLEQIKSLVDAAKAAARDHPNPAGVDTLKKEALDLAKLVKELGAVTKPDF